MKLHNFRTVFAILHLFAFPLNVCLGLNPTRRVRSILQCCKDTWRMKVKQFGSSPDRSSLNTRAQLETDTGYRKQEIDFLKLRIEIRAQSNSELYSK